MIRRNGLSIVLFGLFAVCIVGQTMTGWMDANHEAKEHQEAAIPLTDYLASGHFWEATGENWESEFLQMALFVLLTTRLYQHGSAESKRPGVIEDVDLDPRRFRDSPDVPGPVRTGGWRLKLYENSLGGAFLLLFAISFAMHALGGHSEYSNNEQTHGRPPATVFDYVDSSRFWFESFQNWQSEFLSLAVMVVATIHLRQRGSAQSKPVYASHEETGRG